MLPVNFELSVPPNYMPRLSGHNLEAGRVLTPSDFAIHSVEDSRGVVRDAEEVLGDCSLAEEVVGDSGDKSAGSR